MPEAPFPGRAARQPVPPQPIPPQPIPPRPPIATRQYSQVEAFFILRRNPLELWGRRAYEEDLLDGKFFGRDQLMLNAPEAIRHVLVTNQANYRRNTGARRVLAPLLGQGLFLAEGEAWRHQRRTIAPAMAPRTLPVLARHVVTASAMAEQALRETAGAPTVLMPHLQHLALDIAGQSMFSLEMSGFRSELRSTLMAYALKFAQPGVLDLLLPASLPSPLDFGRHTFRQGWLRFLDQLIDAREAQSDTGQPRDLLDLLRAARDPTTGAAFTRAQLRDEVATMILAGHETTAVTLFWSCYLAALLPDYQDAIAAEVASIDLSPDHAASAHLPVTRAFIDEALRLYPPAFLIVREAIGGDTIMGRPIAPDTVVSISPWVVHRHRAHWQAPDMFDPARFAPGAPVPERFTYMPFGAGPRICVGMQFALTEATLVMARLIQAFRLSLVGRGRVVPRGFVTTQPDRPVAFRITPRG